MARARKPPEKVAEIAVPLLQRTAAYLGDTMAEVAGYAAFLNGDTDHYEFTGLFIAHGVEMGKPPPDFVMSFCQSVLEMPVQGKLRKRTRQPFTRKKPTRRKSAAA